MRLLHLFACLFCFFSFDGFGQSVYEDAKKLKEVMENKDEQGDLWFNLTEFKQLNYFLINKGHPSFKGTSIPSIYRPTVGNYLLLNALIGDTLVIYKLDSDIILASFPIRYKDDYNIINLEDATENNRMLILSPNRDTIFVSDKKFKHDEIVIQINYSMERSFERMTPNFVYLEPKSIQYGVLYNNHLTINQIGYYYFESLPEGDTLTLISSGKTVLSIYFNQSGFDYDSLVIESTNGIEKIGKQNRQFYFDNRFDEIFVFCSQCYFPILMIDKSVNAPSLNLVLKPKFHKNSNYYLIHPNSNSNLENYISKFL